MKNKVITLDHIPIISEDQFRGSYNESWRADSPVSFLRNSGIFKGIDKYGRNALTYGSPLIVPFTILGLYTHFSGYLGVSKLSKEGRATAFSASTERRTSGQKDWRKYLEGQLDFKFNEDFLGVNGSNYTRLLVLAGFSASMNPDKNNIQTKATRGALLPEYLTFPIKRYEELSARSKITARTLTRLVVDSFCDTRFVVKNSDHGAARYSLVSQPSKEMLFRSGRQIIDAMNLLYPALKLSECENICRIEERKDRNVFEGMICIPNDQLRRLPAGNRFPAKLRVANVPDFSINALKKFK